MNVSRGQKEKYIASVLGRKGTVMTEIDKKILDLFCGMSAQQKEEVIHLAQTILASEQEEAVSGPVS